MALSNWDTLAFDTNHQPHNGVLTCTDGVQLEIYKNWLYLHDEAGWHEHGTFVRPVVAELTDGHLRYRQLYVRATRGPMDGVYVAAWQEDYTDPDRRQFMAGCGVYGWAYERDIPEPEMPESGASAEEIQAWVQAHERVTTERGRANWVGVTQTCVDFLLDWLETIERDELPAWAAGLAAGARSAQLLRFNQGDLYLGERLASWGELTDEPITVATPVGEQAEPLFTQLLPRQADEEPERTGEGR